MFSFAPSLALLPESAWAGWKYQRRESRPFSDFATMATE
jgi:hypothetical protein